MPLARTNASVIWRTACVIDRAQKSFMVAMLFAGGAS
jgi:hypothetical protein